MLKTGGYTIIPIVDSNGDPVTITTTSKSIKTGTYAKIVRAIKYQKQICFVGLNLDGKEFTAGGVVSFLGNYSLGYLVLPYSYVATNGQVGTGTIRISANDTIIGTALA